MEDNDSIFSDIKTTEAEGSYIQRVLINLIDWAIEMLILIVAYIILPEETVSNLLDTSSYAMYIIIFALMFLYRLVFLFLLNKTIGMMICRIKYLNSGLEPLSPKQKLVAVFATRTSEIRFYKEN